MAYVAGASAGTALPWESIDPWLISTTAYVAGASAATALPWESIDPWLISTTAYVARASAASISMGKHWSLAHLHNGLCCQGISSQYFHGKALIPGSSPQRLMLPGHQQPVLPWESIDPWLISTTAYVARASTATAELGTIIIWPKIDHTLNSQQTPHNSPSRVSYGMSLVSTGEKIDHVRTAAHCIAMGKHWSQLIPAVASYRLHMAISHYGVSSPFSANGRK